MGALSSYLTGLLHNLSFALTYFESNHLIRGHYDPTRGNLHLMATCRPFLLETSARVLRPKPVKPATDGFEARTTKPPASSVLHTRPPPLDTCHRRPRPTVR
jgi:hypothetical protein